jgi:hypothetical protein
MKFRSDTLIEDKHDKPKHFENTKSLINMSYLYSIAVAEAIEEYLKSRQPQEKLIGQG